MTKGIRSFVNDKFGELLPARAELGNTGFRRAVMHAAMLTFGISESSAATHYNHSLKTVKSIDPEVVDGLGRPEGKKGGRKPVHVVNVVKVKTGEIVATGVSRAAAETMVIAALGKGKVKLAIQDDAPVAAAPVEAVTAEAVTA